MEFIVLQLRLIMKLQKPLNWLLFIEMSCELRNKISAHIFILLFLFLSSSTIAQNQNSLWCFGDSAGINFSDTSNLITFSSALDSRGSCVSIADSTGQLLFYANTRARLAGPTTLVWNNTNQLMEGGDSIIGEAWYNELIIIPYPGSNSLYYLFSVGAASSYGLYYSIIDMNENGGLGKVIQKNVQIHSYQTWDALTAIKHANGRDWWLITKDNRSGSPNGSNVFTEYLITDTGISEILQNSGSYVYGGAGTMSFSKFGNKFLFTTWAGLIETFDFDRCTGLFSNPIVVSGIRLTGSMLTIGSSFSPNGNTIYVSQNDTTSYLFQYDLTAANITASKDTLSMIASPKLAGGSLRLAPNDKIYWTCVWNNGVTNNYPYADTMYHTENMNLSVINDPNVVGSGCNFSLYSFNLGGKRCYWGLPNNPEYDLGPVVGSVCDSLVNGIVEIKNESIQLFPNPTSNQVTISSSTTFLGNQLKIINTIGKLMKTIKLPDNQNLTTISVEDLEPGIYTLEILNSTTILKTEKLVIIK